MIWFINHPNRISGSHISLDDYSQVRPGSLRFGEASRRQLIIRPNPKPPARHPRLGNFKNSGPYLPTLSDKRIVHVDAFSGKVLTELAVCRPSADSLLPPSYVFDGVCVNGLVRSAVRLAVRLLVSI